MATPYSYERDKEALVSRMKKIEGQARGIQRMVEENRYCLDIVQQLTALSGAIDEVSLMVLKDHIAGCVAQAVRENPDDPHIKELIDVIRKVMKR
ncbi:MAG: metal-sensitive transcriptional regulator [Chloroflexi bacterium]|nr:metal-sensitive transcriptional regulator [Chloroflexota bacterium]